MTVDSHTRRYPEAPPPPPAPKRSGFNPLTLSIAAASAVVAAVVVGRIWPGGTLWATAMTPVIVSLVKESLERPAQKIPTVAPLPRFSGHGDPIAEDAADEPATYKAYGVGRKHWKIAAITGLVAFVIAALVLTVPELVAGRSVTHPNRGTSLWGGKSSKKSTKTDEKTQTTPANTTQTTPQDQQQQQTTPGATTPETVPTTPAQTTPTEPQQTTPAEPQQTTPAQPPAQTVPAP
jgi:hypothetical protein